MTHREFVMLCEENVDRTHDFNEREAMYAIMYAAASRGKGKRGKLPEVSDLYKRPDADEIARSKAEDVFEQQQKAMEWLSNFDLSGITGNEGKSDS